MNWADSLLSRAAEALECRGDRRLRAGTRPHVALAGDGDAALGGDLVDDGAGRVPRPVVDDDLRAAARQEEGVLATEPASGAGDHGDAAVEAELGALVWSSRLEVS